MTSQAQEAQAAATQPTDKELNFRALEARYQKQLEAERKAREEAERKAQELSSKQSSDDEEEDDEPYIDKKKLNKTLNKFGQQTITQTKAEIQQAVHQALAQERQQNWIKQNPDFYDVLQHADKFAAHDPELAETILEMPEGFERQKLVYKNIKALGLHKPKETEPTIQQKIDANRKSPYYQPSGVSSAPYGMQSDFSPAGQKNAYEKMQELKAKLRL